MTLQRFRKRPGEVDAMQWNGLPEDAHPIIQWVNGIDDWTAVWREYQPYYSGGLFPQMAQDRVEEGIYVKRAGSWKEQYVGPGDYLMRTEPEDGFQVCKRTAFEADYEPLP